MPTPQLQLANLNVPDPISAPDTNAQYKQVAENLAKTIDLDKRPCDYFYQYTCGKIGSRQTSIQQVNRDVAQFVSNGIEAIDLSTPGNDMYKSIKQFYTQCTSSIGQADKPTVDKFIADLKAREIDFPIFDGSTKDYLTKEKFGTALGYLSGTKGINT